MTYWWQRSGLRVCTGVWMSLQITSQCMTNWRPSRSSLWPHTKGSPRRTAPSSSLCQKTQNCPTMVNFNLNFERPGLEYVSVIVHPLTWCVRASSIDKQSWFAINLVHLILYKYILKTRGMKMTSCEQE